MLGMVIVVFSSQHEDFVTEFSCTRREEWYELRCGSGCFDVAMWKRVSGHIGIGQFC
jgi:hypothetical protein